MWRTAVGLILATAAVQARAEAPPSGWVGQRTMGVDSSPRWYHDSVSGAFVTQDICFTRYSFCKEKPADGYSETGVYWAGRYWLYLGIAPKAGCTSLSVTQIPTARPETREHSSAQLCGEAQLDRVRYLLLKCDLDTITESRDLRFGHIKSSAVADLRPGATYEQVIADHGSPSGADAGVAGGLVLKYLRVPDLGTVTLSFDQDRRLVSVVDQPADKGRRR